MLMTMAPKQWILMAVNILAGAVASAAIYVRIKDKERRFLVKKTERAEGTYWVVSLAYCAKSTPTHVACYSLTVR